MRRIDTPLCTASSYSSEGNNNFGFGGGDDDDDDAGRGVTVSQPLNNMSTMGTNYHTPSKKSNQVLIKCQSRTWIRTRSEFKNAALGT